MNDFSRNTSAFIFYLSSLIVDDSWVALSS